MIIPVVFCFDKRIILGASVAIKSLIDCAKDSTVYDIRIFHSDLDIENQKNITKLCENTKHNISFHYVNPDIFNQAPKSKGSWSEIVYYRLLIPELIQEYDKVIYSDVDVLFKDDLSELYNTNLEDFEWAGVIAEKNTKNAKGHKYFEDNKNDCIFWSGLMLINSSLWRKNKTIKKLIENAKKYYSELKFYDLDLVNITTDKIKALDFRYCVLQSVNYFDHKKAKEYNYLKEIYKDEQIISAIKNPAIIHYAGNLGKPWRMKKPYQDYLEYINKLPKELKKYTFRDIRKRFFNNK